MKSTEPEAVLFVDVQASGTPGNGILLEVAWKMHGSSTHSFLVKNSGGESIPSRVRRITGITDEDTERFDALPGEELRKLFVAAAGLSGTGSPLTLVAHHAVYEKRWLDWLTGLDLEFLCTRELAADRFPELPSGTLRAVAGAVGYYLGEKRRARDHVLATEAVYTAVRSSISLKSVSREERLSVPGQPGVYRFLDSGGNLLYIGKAKNLRKRVNSHFTGRQKGRHAELVSRTAGVLCQTTENALQAAMVESRLIRELSPQYNIAGKVHSEKLIFLNQTTCEFQSAPAASGNFGPFSSTLALTEFLHLKALLEGRQNKRTFVENLWPKNDDVPFEEAFSQWREELGDQSVSLFGLKLHFEAGEEGNSGEHCEYVGVEQVTNKLNSLVISGTLMLRKSAAHRLLQGCVLRWKDDISGEFVHKFVENSVTDHWNSGKLQDIKVLLAEIRRISREGKSPEIQTRFGTVIKEASLKYLLDSV